MLICKLEDLKSGNCFRSEFIGKDQTGREDIYAKKCGCSEYATWISGYNRGIEHTKADAEKYKLALFAVIRNSKVLPKGLILGKSATEINKMSRETMDEVLKSLDFEKIRGWTMDGEPDSGFAWTEECGSISGERVYAWMPMEDIGIADLPEGVESRNFESMEI